MVGFVSFLLFILLSTDIPVPATARPGLLPQTQSTPQGFETAELVAERQGRAEGKLIVNCSRMIGFM
jgi:hypothetical protein